MDHGESVKGRTPKSRLAPEVYFLPRRPRHVSFAIYGTIILAGVGAGVLLEQWINARVLEDGGYVTLGAKKEEFEGPSLDKHESLKSSKLRPREMSTGCESPSLLTKRTKSPFLASPPPSFC
ncbi:hypothetical protein R1flu_002792 [Riccia fluitans]|uniref:Uncharacterized protein n=1 Tax=Riccia fluitans TaxID=41844 RepID=A0ABD1Y744_9MARC